MPTERSAKPSEFARVDGRSVVAEFDGGAVTSDAGGPLLGAADKAIGLVRRLAGCFTTGATAASSSTCGDAGRPARVRHPSTTMTSCATIP